METKLTHTWWDIPPLQYMQSFGPNTQAMVNHETEHFPKCQGNEAKTMKKYEVTNYEAPMSIFVEADRVEILDGRILAFYKDWDMVAAFSSWVGFKVV